MKNKKFNIIDLVITLAIIVVICAGVFAYMFIFNSSDNVTSDTTSIRFNIEVNGITEEAANCFKPGDPVTLGESASGSGVIEGVEVSKHKKLTIDMQNGTHHWTEVPGEYTATVTIVSDVVKSSDSYTTGSEVIAVGKKMPFNARGAASEESYIVDLSEVE